MSADVSSFMGTGADESVRVSLVDLNPGYKSYRSLLKFL
jgi:hypothetical protein